MEFIFAHILIGAFLGIALPFIYEYCFNQHLEPNGWKAVAASILDEPFAYALTCLLWPYVLYVFFQVINED